MAQSEVTPSTSEHVLGELRAAMQSEFGLKPDEIQLETHLVDDLDLDSIDWVDLAVRLEETLGFTLPEEQLKSVLTVQDVVELIHGALTERRAGSE